MEMNNVQLNANAELEKCLVCDGYLDISRTNNNYFACDTCKTHFLIKTSESCTVEFYEVSYLQNINAERKTLSLNVTHYNSLFKQLSRIDAFNSMLNDIESIDECHCYGGGFPQIEMHLPVNKIIVYDLIAQIYRKNLSLFKEFYDTSSIKIDYKKHDLLKGVIKSNTPIFISFVHILEHFSVNNTKLIFNSIKNNIPNGSYGLIYQPNIIKARNKDWVHYGAGDQHVTFLTFQIFKNLLNNYSLEVIHEQSFSDDLLILFKKV